MQDLFNSDQACNRDSARFFRVSGLLSFDHNTSGIILLERRRRAALSIRYPGRRFPQSDLNVFRDFILKRQ